VGNLLSNLLTYIPQIRKAIAAGILATGAMYSAFELSDNTVTGWEWAALVGAFAAAGLGTFAVKNAEPSPGPTPPPPS
jgi:uncharacterized membrane-anchored protein